MYVCNCCFARRKKAKKKKKKKETKPQRSTISLSHPRDNKEPARLGLTTRLNKIAAGYHRAEPSQRPAQPAQLRPQGPRLLPASGPTSVASPRFDITHTRTQRVSLHPTPSNHRPPRTPTVTLPILRPLTRARLAFHWLPHQPRVEQLTTPNAGGMRRGGGAMASRNAPASLRLYGCCFGWRALRLTGGWVV